MDQIEENEFADIVVKAVATLFPGDPPLFLVRTPHGHHDTTKSEAELRAVGFETATTEAVVRESMSPSARTVAVGFCQGTPMRNEIEARDTVRLEDAVDAAAAAIAARYGSGQVSGKMKAYVVVAVR